MLPTSLMTAPGLTQEAIFSVMETIWKGGVQITTSSAAERTARQFIEILSQAPRRRARRSGPTLRPKPMTRQDFFRALEKRRRAKPRDPPINPRPTMTMVLLCVLFTRTD